MVTPKSRRRGRSGMELLLHREWVRSEASPPAAHLGLPSHRMASSGLCAMGGRALPALSPNQWIVEGLAEQGEDRAQNGGDAEEERRQHQQHIEAKQRPNQSRHGAFAT